jgi:hypothetical protein
MIDWINVGANGLWILGCALALASFSYASWRASQEGGKLSAHLESPGTRQALYLAGLLFCVGLAILAGSLFERVLWVFLSLAFGVGLILGARRKNSAPEDISRL